jgi:serine kinase of HPr protein (carbohydrate metabolism regulator)
MAYLKSLPPARRRDVLADLLGLPIACLIITNNLTPPRRLVQGCTERRIPLLRVRVPSGVLVSRLTRFLEERLSDRTRVHGVLVDVFGIGVLLRGKSGIGKSEAALDLLTRGHRLVADDLVEIRKIAPKRLLARATSGSASTWRCRARSTCRSRDPATRAAADRPDRAPRRLDEAEPRPDGSWSSGEIQSMCRWST